MIYLKNSRLKTAQLAERKSASRQPMAHQFCWTGQLVGWVDGQTLPGQSLDLRVVCVHYGDDAPILMPLQSVRLGKSLRRMMMGYLSQSDWLRVLGKCKVDARSGELIWKAQEIIKLSAAQIQRLDARDLNPQPSQRASDGSPIAPSQPVRVLICQQSSCRQRGSVAVSQAIDDALNASPGCSQVSVQAVGCLKNCKLGPNVRLFPKGTLQQKGLSTHYDTVTPAIAREIVNGLDLVLGN